MKRTICVLAMLVPGWLMTVAVASQRPESAAASAPRSSSWREIVTSDFIVRGDAPTSELRRMRNPAFWSGLNVAALGLGRDAQAAAALQNALQSEWSPSYYWTQGLEALRLGRDAASPRKTRQLKSSWRPPPCWLGVCLDD